MKIRMLEKFTGIFENVAETPVTSESVSSILGGWGTWTGGLLSPLLAVLLVTGLFVGALIQGGFVFSLQPLSLNLSRLNPVTGAQNMFSGKMGFGLFRDFIKVLLIGWVCYHGVREAITFTLERADVELAQMLSNISQMVVSLALKAALVLLILGIVDYAYMRRRYFQDLKMTKREVKDEFKQSEGDPLIKGRIRRLQREAAFRRMMQAVPKADVVLTNPTEIAVALKYDGETMNAPQVVAKGQRLIAEKIKALAKEFGVPVVEDRFLARSLFKSTEIGEEIPMELYRAVAEILSYVYRLKGKLSPLASPAR
jgi:flagellar biosynthetic protein FlhB